MRRLVFVLLLRRHPRSALFPYTTLFRSSGRGSRWRRASPGGTRGRSRRPPPAAARRGSSAVRGPRSEEHTSELQSRPHLVCRLLLEKKKPYLREASTALCRALLCCAAVR